MAFGGRSLGLWVVGVPVGSYRVPFFGYPILVLGIYKQKIGYPKRNVASSLAGPEGPSSQDLRSLVLYNSHILNGVWDQSP